jgi:hypothetical protein
MNSWLFRSLVVLYPKAWRERYSKEVGDLSAELLAAGETTRLHLALGLAMSALAERVRSVHKGRSMAVLSGSAALVVVVVATFLVTNSFGLGGGASPRVTPVGWSPSSYGDAQVSAPPSPPVLVSLGSGRTGLQQVIATAASTASGQLCLAAPGGTVVCLLHMGMVPPAYAGEKPTVINGVPVYFGAKGDYYAPSLGVVVTASGPLARRIVDTLTRSRIPGCLQTSPRSPACVTGVVEVVNPPPK